MRRTHKYSLSLLQCCSAHRNAESGTTEDDAHYAQILRYFLRLIIHLLATKRIQFLGIASAAVADYRLSELITVDGDCCNVSG